MVSRGSRGSALSPVSLGDTPEAAPRVACLGNPGYTPLMGRELGRYLRELRSRRAKSLKGAAPELGVSHAYLSKLETGAQNPSDELLGRLAEYYDADADVLAILAGRIPDDVLHALQAAPEEAARVLRERFGSPSR